MWTIACLRKQVGLSVKIQSFHSRINLGSHRNYFLDLSVYPFIYVSVWVCFQGILKHVNCGLPEILRLQILYFEENVQKQIYTHLCILCVFLLYHFFLLLFLLRIKVFTLCYVEFSTHYCLIDKTASHWNSPSLSSPFHLAQISSWEQGSKLNKTWAHTPGSALQIALNWQVGILGVCMWTSVKRYSTTFYGILRWQMLEISTLSLQ